jgi:glutamate 5-kinase
LLAGIKDTTGGLVIDDGAVRALRKGGSLLPVGIVGTVGDFTRGQSVKITDQHDHTVAVGLVNYDVADVQRISGKQSEEIDRSWVMLMGQKLCTMTTWYCCDEEKRADDQLA